MNRSPEEFKTKVKENNIEKWNIRDCSVCGCFYGYVFSTNIYSINHEVVIDTSCDCTTYNPLRKSSWEEVARYYNIQTNLKIIENMDKFWGFK